MFFQKKLAALFLATSMLVGCNESGNSYSSSGSSAEQSQVSHIKVKLKQSRFSLDLGQHAKDSMNAVTFSLPVAYENRNDYKSGDNLVDKFRAGSLLVNGSLGKWKLTVVGVPQVEEPEEKTSYRVRLKLHQSHISLDLFKHAKDAMNTIEFDWDVPKEVYDSVEVGDDFIEDGFRGGSLLVDGSIGSWNLDVVEKRGISPNVINKAQALPFRP